MVGKTCVCTPDIGELFGEKKPGEGEPEAKEDTDKLKPQRQRSSGGEHIFMAPTGWDFPYHLGWGGSGEGTHLSLNSDANNFRTLDF